MSLLSSLRASKREFVDRRRTCWSLLSCRFWRGGRNQVVAHQPTRSVFRQNHASDVGELVYKHTRRYYYLAMYAMISLATAGIWISSGLWMLGYHRPEYDRYDEQTRYGIVIASLLCAIPLYVIVRVLISRTLVYIFYNESKRQFCGIHYSWCMVHKKIVFKPGEVQMIPRDSSVLQIFRGCYIIDKKQYHISPPDFKFTRHYNVMLGFIDPWFYFCFLLFDVSLEVSAFDFMKHVD